MFFFVGDSVASSFVDVSPCRWSLELHEDDAHRLECREIVSEFAIGAEGAVATNHEALASESASLQRAPAKADFVLGLDLTIRIALV